MAIKCTFKKHKFDYPMHECFFCRGKPTGILTFIWTGEEVRACEKCYIERRRGRKPNKKQSNDRHLIKNVKISQLNEEQSKQNAFNNENQGYMPSLVQNAGVASGEK